MAQSQNANILPPGTKATSKEGASWKSLNINGMILHVLVDVLGFENMTPVQAVTIPHFIQNKDVAVEVRISYFFDQYTGVLAQPTPPCSSEGPCIFFT